MTGLEPRKRAPPGSTKLTRRDHDMMWLLAEGLSVKEAASRLGLTYHGAKWRINNIMRKLKARSRTRAVVEFVLKYDKVARSKFCLPGPVVTDSELIMYIEHLDGYEVPFG